MIRPDQLRNLIRLAYHYNKDATRGVVLQLAESLEEEDNKKITADILRQFMDELDNPTKKKKRKPVT